MSPIIRQEELDRLKKTIEENEKRIRELRMKEDFIETEFERENRSLREGISKLHSELGQTPLLRQKCDTKEKIIQDLIKKNQTLKKQNKKIINSKNRLQRELLKKYKENERGQKD